MNGAGLDDSTDYTGHNYDNILDKFYAQARFYDATNKRFVSEDPTKDGSNWYAYCNDNPIMYTDPTGLINIFDVALSPNLYNPFAGMSAYETTDILILMGQNADGKDKVLMAALILANFPFKEAEIVGSGITYPLDYFNANYNKCNAVDPLTIETAKVLLTGYVISGFIPKATGTGKDIVGTSHNAIKPTQDAINPQKVAEYAKRLQAGEKLPAIEVVDVPGKGKYIIEGHHRYVASQQTGIPIDIIVTQNKGPIGMADWSNVQWKAYTSESQFWD